MNEVAKLRKRIKELEKSEIEHKRLLDALLKSEEKYRNLTELSPDAILTIDRKGKVTSCNTLVTKGTGYSKEEIIGNHFSKLGFLPPKDISKYMTLFTNAVRGRILKPFEVAWYHKDGTPYLAEIRMGSIKEKGKTIGIQIAARDITWRKRAEEEKEILQAQLIQSEKMTGLETLASGIAHEFNNLLQIMSGYVQIAKKTKKADDMEKAFDIVLSTTDKAANIIRGLVSFSRAESSGKKLCSIEEPLESVLSLLEGQLKKNNIKVVRKVVKYGKTSKLEINTEEMQRVFLHMVTNARDAMLPKGGRLDISISQEKDYVKVSFHDTGKGIKEKDLGRVFEPFYTTKGAVGGDSTIVGTGLGLSVSYGIVRRHGGTIVVESKRGKGTTFTVSLPVQEK